MRPQVRSFSRLIIDVEIRLNKVGGHLSWLGEKAQFSALDGHDVDAFYERWYALEDAITRLKASPQWRSVDVPDSDELE